MTNKEITSTPNPCPTCPSGPGVCQYPDRCDPSLDYLGYAEADAELQEIREREAAGDPIWQDVYPLLAHTDHLTAERNQALVDLEGLARGYNNLTAWAAAWKRVAKKWYSGDGLAQRLDEYSAIVREWYVSMQSENKRLAASLEELRAARDWGSELLDRQEDTIQRITARLEDAEIWATIWKQAAKKWFHRGEVAEGLNILCEMAIYKMRKREEENLASLDAEATAHSLTRAALVASPEWVGLVKCEICGGLRPSYYDELAADLFLTDDDIRGHAPDCTRQVALYGDDWRKETEE